MTHRYGCEQPTPERRTTRLSTGAVVHVDRCPDCGAVALTRTPTEGTTTP